MDILRISTASLPAAQRIPVFREVFGRQILKIDVEPEPDAAFEADMVLQVLPGLGIGAGTLSPMRNRLSRDLIDNDDLVFVILRSGMATARQYGHETTIGGGQAIVTANDAPATFDAHTPTEVVNLRFARKRIISKLVDADASVLRPMSRDNQALRMLDTYVRSVRADPGLSAPQLLKTVADHIHDLAVLALGANKDAAEIARHRGLRAARLDAALRHIRALYDDPEISPNIIAARLGISTRYLHKLLQETGESFSERVQDLRLEKAFALLSNTGGRAQKVNDAAYAAGFNDLSHFNRLFRRKYGITPTAARGHRNTAFDESSMR